jgi:hypothetical protein
MEGNVTNSGPLTNKQFVMYLYQSASYCFLVTRFSCLLFLDYLLTHSTSVRFYIYSVAYTMSLTLYHFSYTSLFALKSLPELQPESSL